MEAVPITGYHDVPQDDEQSLLKGVFSGSCGASLGHGAAAAVGYGSSKGIRLYHCEKFLGTQVG
jgi:xylem cysteine proteinase